MNITELDAKDKWCPMSPPATYHAGANCIGSSCMLWRWARLGDDRLPKGLGHGHCGLGDQPTRKSA